MVVNFQTFLLIKIMSTAFKISLTPKTKSFVRFHFNDYKFLQPLHGVNIRGASLKGVIYNHLKGLLKEKDTVLYFLIKDIFKQAHEKGELVVSANNRNHAIVFINFLNEYKKIFYMIAEIPLPEDMLDVAVEF